MEIPQNFQETCKTKLKQASCQSGPLTKKTKLPKIDLVAYFFLSPPYHKLKTKMKIRKSRIKQVDVEMDPPIFTMKYETNEKTRA